MGRNCKLRTIILIFFFYLHFWIIVNYLSLHFVCASAKRSSLNYKSRAPSYIFKIFTPSVRNKICSYIKYEWLNDLKFLEVGLYVWENGLHLFKVLKDIFDAITKIDSKNNSSTKNWAWLSGVGLMVNEVIFNNFRHHK